MFQFCHARLNFVNFYRLSIFFPFDPGTYHFKKNVNMIFNYTVIKLYVEK